jgi:hypothetical protein
MGEGPGLDVLGIAARRLRAAGCAVERAPGGELKVAARVVMREQRLGDERVLAVLAPICAEDQVAPRVVLERASLMGCGALALLGDTYVVRVAVTAAQVETAPLGSIVDYVATLADQLAVWFTADRALPTSLFAHYND